MVQEADWQGRLDSRRNDECQLTIGAITNDRAREGGSQPFQVMASDGQLYWLKSPDNPQGPRVPVTEQVIARCGLLIGAPVCKMALVRIPPELNGHRLATGRQLCAGIAHGSTDLATAIYGRAAGPEHRDKDNNAERHAYIFALYDWCWGSDCQWLYDSATDMMTYSHDHGHYLPGGPNWSRDTLCSSVDEEHELTTPFGGLNPQTLLQAAEKIQSVRQLDLVSVIGLIPASWPITDQDLEVLGFFLDRRREPVAARLRRMAGRIPGPVGGS